MAFFMAVTLLDKERRVCIKFSVCRHSPERQELEGTCHISFAIFVHDKELTWRISRVQSGRYSNLILN